MLNTSFKFDTEILSQFTLFPHKFTIKNYVEIFNSSVWMGSFLNSLEYVFINVIITLSVSIPAAYAFSRWKFKGDHHLFFGYLLIGWLRQ